MNPLHLLWICPVCYFIGVALSCLCVISGRDRDE